MQLYIRVKILGEIQMNNEIAIKQRENLNIFQKIRLKFQENKKQISFEEYIKLPKYIQEDSIMIRKLFRTNNLTEEQIIQIPGYQMKMAIGTNNLLNKLSLPKKAEFIEKGYLDVISIGEEEKNNLLDFMIIQNKQYEFIKHIIGSRTYEINCLRFFKEKGELEEVLPHVIDYLSETVKEIIEKKPDLLNNLSFDKQENYIQKKNDLLLYANPEIQQKFIDKDIRYLKFANNEVKKTFIEKNPDLITKLDSELQVQMVSLNPSLIKKLPYEVQKDIFTLQKKSNADAEKYSNVIANLLKYDINNTKYLDFIENNEKGINSRYYKLFDGIEKWNNDEIINTILHSKMMSAIGCIDDLANLRSGNLFVNDGKVRYSKEQIKILQNLSKEPISELINIDSNYSLAFFLDKENAKEECKQLFSYIYGEKKLKQYEKCIDIIFNKNEKETKVKKNREGYRTN